jgi:hypothetical protein
MLTPLVIALLAASPVKIAATGFQVTGGIESQRADVWLERFAEVMRRDGRISISTSNDIAQLLGVERQKQLLGCSIDGSSCIAELADALGAAGVLVGTFTKSGDSYLVVVRVLRQPGGDIWWSASGRVTGESALLDWLDEQAAACADALAPKPKRSVVPIVLGGVGLVTAVAGGALLAVSHTVGLQAVRDAPTEPELGSALNTGRAESSAGVVLIGVGAAAFVGALVWRFAERDPAVPIVAMPIEGGAMVSVGGTW